MISPGRPLLIGDYHFSMAEKFTSELTEQLQHLEPGHTGPTKKSKFLSKVIQFMD